MTPLSRLALLSMVFLPTSLIGCGGGDDDEPDSLQGFAGTYEVRSYMTGSDSCSATDDGLETLSEAYMIGYVDSFFGIDFLTFESCASPQDCEDRRAASEAGEFTSSELRYSITESTGADSALGQEALAGSSGDSELCRRTYTETTLDRSGDTVTLVSTEQSLEDGPKDADGFCEADIAVYENDAEGAPCSDVEALELVKLD